MDSDYAKSANLAVWLSPLSDWPQERLDKAMSLSAAQAAANCPLPVRTATLPFQL